MKTCSRCGVTKPLDDFHHDGRGKGGLRADCKDCVRARNRELYAADRENRLAERRTYYEANRERCIADMRAYDEAHREEKAARMQAYREARRDEAAVRTRAWRKAHPDKCRAYGREKRARKLAVPYENIDSSRVYLRDKGLCGICGQLTDPTDWHLDHIVPLAKGGHHIYDNVQVAHPFCNMSKGAKVASLAS